MLILLLEYKRTAIMSYIIGDFTPKFSIRLLNSSTIVLIKMFIAFLDVSRDLPGKILENFRPFLCVFWPKMPKKCPFSAPLARGGFLFA